VCWKPCSSCWSFHLLQEEFLSALIHSPLSGSPYRSFRHRLNSSGEGLHAERRRLHKAKDMLSKDQQGCCPTQGRLCAQGHKLHHRCINFSCKSVPICQDSWCMIYMVGALSKLRFQPTNHSSFQLPIKE
jgi:hypothetical protein